MLSKDHSTYEETLTIPTYECDADLRWKPSAFLQHMTAAANKHIDLLGEGYQALLDQGLVWVLSRMKLHFLRFPRVEEQITIRTWPKTIQQKLFFIRDYEIRSAEDELLTAATSAWLMMNMQTRRLVAPSALQLNLPQNPDRQALAEPLEKLTPPADGEERLRLRAGSQPSTWSGTSITRAISSGSATLSLPFGIRDIRWKRCRSIMTARSTPKMKWL